MMRRFYSPPESFLDGTVMLDASETHHLRHVLRLHPGDEVSVFNGLGGEFLCSIVAIGKDEAKLSITRAAEALSPESPLDITLAATILNGEKYDLVIQKAVELGVKRLIPLDTMRGEVKLKDASKRLGRWRRITLEATKQCGRAFLMEVAEPVTFARLIDEMPNETVVLFSERDGTGFEDLSDNGKITALIGPKGGWDDNELELARQKAIRIITLGGRILRAETASIAFTAILQHRYGDLN